MTSKRRNDVFVLVTAVQGCDGYIDSLCTHDESTKTKIKRSVEEQQKEEAKESENEAMLGAVSRGLHMSRRWAPAYERLVLPNSCWSFVTVISCSRICCVMLWNPFLLRVVCISCMIYVCSCLSLTYSFFIIVCSRSTLSVCVCVCARLYMPLYVFFLLSLFHYVCSLCVQYYFSPLCVFVPFSACSLCAFFCLLSLLYDSPWWQPTLSANNQHSKLEMWVATWFFCVLCRFLSCLLDALIYQIVMGVL